VDFLHRWILLERGDAGKLVTPLPFGDLGGG
jgi:hypothetical protein